MKHTAAVMAIGMAVGMMTIGTAQADTFGSGTNTFTIDFMNIGDAGNATDLPDPEGAGSLAGAVPYNYRIGNYEISRDIIAKANAVGDLQITMADWDSFGDVGNRPATDVSWNEAARFVNWLNVSSGYSAAYKFDIQPGGAGYSANSDILLWEVGDVGYDANNRYRNSKAFYFLPSLNEWYKAAYYDGSTSTYYIYATGSNTTPNAVSHGTGAGTAVYDQNQMAGPADIDQAGGLSPYGTMGQNGNVWEWIETAATGMNASASEDRAFRGGYWAEAENAMQSRTFTQEAPSSYADGIGFRVASVPEPSAALVVIVAVGAGLLRWRARRSL